MVSRSLLSLGLEIDGLVVLADDGARQLVVAVQLDHVPLVQPLDLVDDGRVFLLGRCGKSRRDG